MGAEPVSSRVVASCRLVCVRAFTRGLEYVLHRGLGGYRATGYSMASAKPLTPPIKRQQIAINNGKETPLRARKQARWPPYPGLAQDTAACSHRPGVLFTSRRPSQSPFLPRMCVPHAVHLKESSVTGDSRPGE